MISLLLTAFLGLFCCSSFSNNVDFTIQPREKPVNEAISIDDDQFFVIRDSEVIPYIIQGYFMDNPLRLNSPDVHGSYNTGYCALYIDPANLNLNAFYQSTIMNCYCVVNYEGTWNESNDTCKIQYYTFKLYTPTALIMTYSIFAILEVGTTNYSYSYHLDSNNTFYLAFSDYNPVTANGDLWRWVQLGMNGDFTGAYNIGYGSGYANGKNDGYTEGYQSGYDEGLQLDYDSTAMTIFSGILEVGLLPVNVFLAILNFEVFGINIAGFVSALLTVAITIIILRFLLGGKENGK